MKNLSNTNIFFIYFTISNAVTFSLNLNLSKKLLFFEDDHKIVANFKIYSCYGKKVPI